MNRSIRFHLVFSQQWVLSKRGDPVLPVEWFLKEVKDRFEVKDVNSRVSECSGKIQFTDIGSSENFLNEMKSMISEKYALDKNSDVFKLEAEEIEETEAAEVRTAAPGKTSSGTAAKGPSDGGFVFDKPSSAKPKRKSAMNRIMDLVGADPFKELAAECAGIAPQLVSNNMPDVLTCRSYLISMNEGYGLTTYLKVFADLVSELRLFKYNLSLQVIEAAPDSPGAGGSDHDPFKLVKDLLQGKSKGNIICIDISDWMTKIRDKKFRDFMKYIDGNTVGDNIVFFRIPYVEQNIVKDIEKNLSDVFTIRTLVIPPFKNDDLIKCAKNFMSERGYTVDDDVWEVFSTRIVEEKSDGKFYGINTVEKIVREMLYMKHICLVANEDDDDKVIHRSDIESIVRNDTINSKSGYEQLEELVGIDKVRERIVEIVTQIEASISNDSISAPCIHMRFVGNPGTGKTTVARIIGAILKEKGILRNGNFFEYAGRDLCGRFIGETAPKTSAICRDAYGSVLFIDEAYSLYRGDDSPHNRDYGREAIDTLIAEMENHRNDLVVIMAGYPDDMEKLMGGNAGLKSRMPYLIEFPNYTKDQLADIFFRIAKKSFSYDDSFIDAVKLYFSSLSDDFLKEKEFSNARFVRNLFERTWGKAAMRCQLAGIGCTSLTVEDFALATSDKEFQNIMEHKRTIGFAN